MDIHDEGIMKEAVEILPAPVYEGFGPSLADSTEENMRVSWSYLEKFGRPLSFKST